MKIYLQDYYRHKSILNKIAIKFNNLIQLNGILFFIILCYIFYEIIQLMV